MRELKCWEGQFPIRSSPCSTMPHCRKSFLPGRNPVGTLVHFRHMLGHSSDAIARRVLLCDALGGRIGAALVFHPAAGLEALPHGEMPEGEQLEESQADFEERMQASFEDAEHCGTPFGVLWINVDQAHNLHKTHGAAACHAMLDKVRHALAQGMRPGEELGRWGADEFLIVSHERTAEMLLAHARTLAGLARTAHFKWWGDLLSITVSIGAAHWRCGSIESLAQLLDRARKAMETSTSTGGNQVTAALPVQAQESAGAALNNEEREAPRDISGGD